MTQIKIAESLVDIVATGSPLPKKEFNQALEDLKALGFQPRFNGSIKKTTGLFAQEENTCFKNFKKALFAEDSQIIWCLRGGYGSQRLLKHLDSINKTLLPKPKLFIGYSDVTVLHDWIHQKWGWPTLHFPVLSQLNHLSKSSLLKLQSLLIFPQTELLFSDLKMLNSGWFKSPIKGKITGGNLTMIQSCVGTPWSFPRKNKILFLEDNVNEKPYTIDRALWQLKKAGVFKGVRGVIFGQWPFKGRALKSLIEDVLKPFAKPLSFPVLMDLFCGHNKVSDPLPLHTPAELQLIDCIAHLTVKNPIDYAKKNILKKKLLPDDE